MSILPNKIYTRIHSSYRRSFDLQLSEVLPSGRCCHEASPGIDNLAPLVNTRAHALNESVRWGEPYIFFLLPNVISWIIPLADESKVYGGLLGGAMLMDNEPCDRLETINYLAASGCRRPIAETFISELPICDQKILRQAADFLFALACCEVEWDMTQLSKNRRQAQRQKQIAEEIHRRKQGPGASTLIDDERTLLALIKVGDHKGARRELNKTLGALFSQTADIRLLKAHVIEMMGYLVRCALEESPQMSSLIEKNHAWMTAIIDTQNFETLSNVVADALDDFMRNFYLQGYNRTNLTVSEILDYLGNNFYRNITLKKVSLEVGLSTFRISHLIKDVTGKTVIQHIHSLRIQEAQRLLEQSSLSCTDIAYETGFGDQSYFIKQFRKQMGITPAKYRRLYLNVRTSVAP